MHRGIRGELITVSFGIQSAKSCLRAFVPHNHHPMFLFPGPTIFVYQGWKSPVSSPLMRVCVGSGGFAPALAGSFGGVQPPRSWAVATVVSCLDCRMLVTYTLLN